MVTAEYCSFGFHQGPHCVCSLFCAHEKHCISSSVRDLPSCVRSCGGVAICPRAVADVPPIFRADTPAFQARPGSSAARGNSECNFALCPGTYGPWIRVRRLSRTGAINSNNCNCSDDPSRQSRLGILGLVCYGVKANPAPGVSDSVRRRIVSFDERSTERSDVSTESLPPCISFSENSLGGRFVSASSKIETGFLGESLRNPWRRNRGNYLLHRARGAASRTNYESRRLQVGPFRAELRIHPGGCLQTRLVAGMAHSVASGGTERSGCEKKSEGTRI
jgi:hypothetical protein